jgi:hypothetical protein
MEVLNTFTPFPRLPQELRLKIWQATMEPRLVCIKWSPRLSQCITPDTPTILQVTHESREEGLKTYRPSFATISSSRPVVYANLSLDTVSFEWETANAYINHFCQGSLKIALKEVKFLTLSNSEFENALHDRLYCLLDEFSELEELLVSGCAETPDRTLVSRPELEEDIKTNIFPAGPNENSDSVPTLVCLDRGYHCPSHWWFKQCNEWCPRQMGRGIELFEKPDWMSIVSSINDGATPS